MVWFYFYWRLKTINFFEWFSISENGLNMKRQNTAGFVFLSVCSDWISRCIFNWYIFVWFSLFPFHLTLELRDLFPLEQSRLRDVCGRLQLVLRVLCAWDDLGWVHVWSFVFAAVAPQTEKFSLPSPPSYTHTPTWDLCVCVCVCDDLPVPLLWRSASNFRSIETQTTLPSPVFCSEIFPKINIW